LLPRLRQVALLSGSLDPDSFMRGMPW